MAMVANANKTADISDSFAEYKAASFSGPALTWHFLEYSLPALIINEMLRCLIFEPGGAITESPVEDATNIVTHSPCLGTSLGYHPVKILP